MIKITTNDFIAGHTTWAPYATLLRIFKYYDFPFTSVPVAAKKVLFSSYPASISSTDDYYITDSQLVVIETTNTVFNASLYKAVTPQALLCWMRTVVANRFTANGKDWVNTFARYNSGTYNNQWMIVDYKLYSAARRQAELTQVDTQEPAPLSLPPGTLWILEQVPGYCETADVTDVLNKQGHWVSYNIPYFSYIFNISGYPEMEKRQGNLWNYEKCPRANIFRRDEPKVSSLSGLQWILRENDYLHDPLSLGDPANAISSRYDLESYPYPLGGVDTKVTSAAMVKDISCLAIAGPTSQSVPPFSWAEFLGWPHFGVPYTYDFDWLQFHGV